MLRLKENYLCRIAVAHIDDAELWALNGAYIENIWDNFDHPQKLIYWWMLLYRDRKVDGLQESEAP